MRLIRMLDVVTGLFALLAMSIGGAQAAPCSITDLNFTIATTNYFPTACADNIGNGSPNVEEANVGIAFGSTFFFAAKNDNVDPSQVPGIDFDLTTTALGGDLYNFVLSWTDTAGSFNLPIEADLAFGIFGASTGAAYFIPDVLFTTDPTLGTGSFEITFVNSGGRIPELSHMDAFLGDIVQRQPPPPVTPVPEPTPLAMFGFGLLGLGLIKRWQKSA